MAFGFEFVAKLGVVIDLAVQHDPARLVLIVYRLLAGNQVDYRQPAHSQPNRAIRAIAFGLHEEPVAVGAAVNDCPAHCTQCGLIDWLSARVRDSHYPAHDIDLPGAVAFMTPAAADLGTDASAIWPMLRNSISPRRRSDCAYSRIFLSPPNIASIVC